MKPFKTLLSKTNSQAKKTRFTSALTQQLCRNTCRLLTGAAAVVVSTLSLATPTRAQDTAFVHWANASNTVYNWTYLDSPIINGNPKATIMVTCSVNPYNQGGVYNAHHVGVWYDTSKQRWAAFNEDFVAMPQGAAFNVWAYRNNGPAAFVHKASVANIVGKYTYIDNPYTNGNPDAKLYVTQLFNAYGFGGTYNNAPIGVYYDAARKQWAIMNTISAVMPDQAAFFVFVDKINLHKATTTNTSGFGTLLDDGWSLLNYYALTFVTNNVAPGGVWANVDPNPAGLLWVNGPNRWQIVNLNGAAMPINNAFNVKQMYAF